MDTNVLLRLIKDDIQILDGLNDSFINETNLSPEEVKVALARAKALVLEFEMLNKNISREEESTVPHMDPEENQEIQPGEKNEKKVRSLRNFLPFIKSEEEHTASSDKNKKNEFSQQTILSNESVQPLQETFTLITDQVQGTEVSLDSSSVTLTESISKKDEQEAVKESAPEAVVEKTPFNNLLSGEKEEPAFGILPLRSIREGIGLNDRFLFIRELFQNNTEKFEQAINTLDEFSGIEDAVKFLKQNFKWNKSETAEKFLSLIKRRFSK